jgi:hypothetical protein
LTDFIASGDAPIYVGFGFMPIESMKHLVRDVGKALSNLKLRLKCHNYYSYINRGIINLEIDGIEEPSVPGES